MYKFSYADILEESASFNRDREGTAFDQVLDAIALAEPAGLQSAEMRSALTDLQKLWSYFIADLASEQNELPKELRANLASLGLWTIQESDHILNDRSHKLAALIDVNRTIRGGLN